MGRRVNILLPTYNGSRYLDALLESLALQTHPDVVISIRDDGSKDETRSLLSAWAVGRQNVRLRFGENIGAMPSFFDLLENGSALAEYFAFCDQDDVWLPDKVERAVSALSRCRSDEPAMYCSRVEYVNERLEHLGYSRVPRRPSFPNALVENITTGCTTVLNRRARDLICGRLPRKALPHDWWCYLVVSAIGKVIYDERPSIRYRQHATNLTGGTPSLWELSRRRLIRLINQVRGKRFLSDQAVEFLRCFGDLLDPQNKKVLDRFLCVRGSLRERVFYNAFMDVWRQSWSDTMILRLLILMGRA